eukprot:CAMPEP_0118802430 /NCGR_PEP_ID=MMETSP1161-20130426/7782_1 /TAXON_ID=249345 /ORGANISM="Picochlorum oklahomensis, Strain CCMP2329" /LENGTH=307 /DNA_ID=CAMNT_0006730649 /DNA_START=202 /DNA_END=1125 /DNA_ORIENTATION=+
MVGMVFFLICVANYAVWRHVLIPGMGDVNILTQLGYAIMSFMYGSCVAMLVWCYIRTVLDSPGEVPAAWYPFEDESQRQYLQHDDGYRKSVLEGYEQALEQATPTDGSKFQLAYMYATRPRWCKKCRKWKPPRSHHCSMMNECVLRMDHYCVWMVNTIGMLNYKSFVLFLMWACIACIMSAVLLFKPCVAFVTSTSSILPVWPLLISFMSFVFTASFSLALIGFIVMHWNLIAKNMTTIEAYEKVPITPWPHDKGGWRENFFDVFGRDPYGWCLPILSPKERQRLLEESLHAPANSLPLYPPTTAHV